MNNLIRFAKAYIVLILMTLTQYLYFVSDDSYVTANMSIIT